MSAMLILAGILTSGDTCWSWAAGWGPGGCRWSSPGTSGTTGRAGAASEISTLFRPGRYQFRIPTRELM